MRSQDSKLRRNKNRLSSSNLLKWRRKFRFYQLLMPRESFKSRTPFMLLALSIWITETRWSKWCQRKHTKKTHQNGTYKKHVMEISFPSLPDRRKMSMIWTSLSTWESQTEGSKGHQRLQEDSTPTEAWPKPLSHLLRGKDPTRPITSSPSAKLFLEWEPRVPQHSRRGLSSTWRLIRRSGVPTTSSQHSSELVHLTTRIPIWNHYWTTVTHQGVRRKPWPSKGISTPSPGCITVHKRTTSPTIWSRTSNLVSKSRETKINPKFSENRLNRKRRYWLRLWEAIVTAEMSCPLAIEPLVNTAWPTPLSEVTFRDEPPQIRTRKNIHTS